VSLSERQSEFHFSSGFIYDFKKVSFNLEDLIKAKKAKKSNGVNALKHKPQSSSSPAVVIVNENIGRNCRRFTKFIDRNSKVEIIQLLE
jgi:hypothetical protein